MDGYVFVLLFLWFHCVVQAQSKAAKVFERKQTRLNPGLVKQSVWHWRPLTSGFRWPEGAVMSAHFLEQPLPSIYINRCLSVPRTRLSCSLRTCVSLLLPCWDRPTRASTTWWTSCHRYTFQRWITLQWYTRVGVSYISIQEVNWNWNDIDHNPDYSNCMD